MMEGNAVGNGRRRGGMSQVGVVGWVLQLRREGMRDWLFRGRCAVIVVVVVEIVTAAEVGGSFVFVGTTILHWISPCPWNVYWCLAHILKSTNCLVYISRRKFVQLFVMSKNDDGHIDRAEHRELMSLFEETTFAFEKRPIDRHQQRCSSSSILSIARHYHRVRC